MLLWFCNVSYIYVTFGRLVIFSYIFKTLQIKRRLFEERVEREKQRRIEREREKAERDRELSKIKRAHQKELDRLKEKIENKV